MRHAIYILTLALIGSFVNGQFSYSTQNNNQPQNSSAPNSPQSYYNDPNPGQYYKKPEKYQPNVGSYVIYFIIGLILIPCPTLIMRKSEMKYQKHVRYLRNLSKDVKMIDSAMPLVQDNFKVCHLKGTVVNPLMVVDEDFGIFAMNSVRIVRTVEMFQWQEVKHTSQRRNSKATTTTYTYHLGWTQGIINSNEFNQKYLHTNPNVEWPFYSDQTQAEELTMGLCFLKKESIDQIGQKNEEEYKFPPEFEVQVANANQKMLEGGFTAFEEQKDDYLMANCRGFEDKDVGQIRVKYKLHKCGEATVIGQQIQDDRGLMTIRMYNPKKKDLPYGESTEVDEIVRQCCGIENAILCCYCTISRLIANEKMGECVHYACDGIITIQKYAEEQAEFGTNKTWGIRLISWIGTNIILWMMVYPLITILAKTFVYQLAFRFASIIGKTAQIEGNIDSGAFFWYCTPLALSFCAFCGGIGTFYVSKPLGLLAILLSFVLLAICLVPAHN